MQALRDKILSLNLSGMAETIDARADYALKHKASYIDFLSQLLEDELNARQDRSMQRRLRHSKLSRAKTLDNYDFAFQPELDRSSINELGACRFIAEHFNIVLMGKPGVGKTHLANALGIEALKLGHRVLFTHANEMLDRMRAARADGTFITVLGKICRYDLLIIDELGSRKLPEQSLDDFFEIIRRRYETGSMIITTNRNFEDWQQILGDAVMASAVIDRILHHAHVVRITGESYRVKHLNQPKAATTKRTKSQKN